jgi:hypothetical protein
VGDRQVQSFLRSCIKKKRFHTSEAAQDRADQYGLRSYYCPSCYGFHLTSSYDRNQPNGAVEMLFKILTVKNWGRNETIRR